MAHVVEKPVEDREAEKSAKVRESDHAAAVEIAKANDTTTKHVISWWRCCYSAMSPRQRNAAKNAIDARYPRTRIRRGRGNLKKAG